MFRAQSVSNDKSIYDCAGASPQSVRSTLSSNSLLHSVNKEKKMRLHIWKESLKRTTNMKNVCNRLHNEHLEVSICIWNVIESRQVSVRDPMACIHKHHLCRDIWFTRTRLDNSLLPRWSPLSWFSSFTFRSIFARGSDRASHTPWSFFASPPGLSVCTVFTWNAWASLFPATTDFATVALSAFDTGDSV